MNREPSGDSYDVIVIGAGIGGLTAGALLAKAGKQVLVVEKEERPGGWARDLRHGTYHFEPAVHLIMGGSRTSPVGQGLVDAVLDHLHVRDRCQFLRAEPFYRVQFPDLSLDVPTGREAFLDAHARHFPGSRRGLTELTELCAKIYRESVSFPIQPRLSDLALMPFRHRRIFRHANDTVGRVLNRHVDDARLKTAYTALWPYLGLPPSRVSFLAWALMMASYIEEGAFFCGGGFQRLADVFAEALESHGGTLVVGEEVKQICVENGRACGVVLANGRNVHAPLVISNIDARLAFGELIEPGHVPSRYVRRLERLEPSLSVMAMYLATDLDINALGVPAETLLYDGWDHDDLLRSATPTRPTALIVNIPTVIDPSLAPEGQHIMGIGSALPHGMSELSHEDRSRFAEAILSRTEKLLPGLRDHIISVAGRSEAKSGKIPLFRLETIYGWAALPGQVAARRLPPETLIPGLLMVGHWTQPGHGIWSVVASGLMVSRIVLGKSPSKGLLPLEI